MDIRPKVTVYIPCNNYGRYLKQAVESVFQQSMPSWEAIIIDDAATDETPVIASDLRMLDPERVRVVTHEKPKGLRACANRALELARGEYVIRLDSDDYLDESAFLVLSRYLDDHADVALVYPNFFYVDENGEILKVEQRRKIAADKALLDLPAHGACTMIRRRVIKSVGGYSEDISSQDGHEVWLKLLHRYDVANVATPLFYYRQHSQSMSRDEDRLLDARRRIKRRLVTGTDGNVRPTIAAIVPAKNSYSRISDVALRMLDGKPLIAHTLDAIVEAGYLDAVCVTSDDDRVVEFCRHYPKVHAMLRASHETFPHGGLPQAVYEAVQRMESEWEIYPDIIAVLSIHCPLRTAQDVRFAIDTLLLYGSDSVISVYEDNEVHYVHGETGLEPINRAMMDQVRLEREALYTDNNAVRVMWRDIMTETNFYGHRIGHIVMPFRSSQRIQYPEDFSVLEAILSRRPCTKGDNAK